MFIKVKVLNDAAHINALFQEVAAGTIKNHSKWSFEMTYQADDALNLQIEDLVIVPVIRHRTHQLEYHVAIVTQIMPADTTEDQFEFRTNFISAKFSLDGDLKQNVEGQRQAAVKADLKNRMIQRAHELAEREKYRKLAETDEEMKKLYEQMYGED